MSEEDLQLLITLDDPVDIPIEDTFNHLQANNFEYWLGQRYPAWCPLDQPGESASNNNAETVSFGDGDWTCTVSRLNEAVTESPNKNLDVQVCTVTQRKNGKIVERKLFYDLLGMQKQFGVM